MRAFLLSLAVLLAAPVARATPMFTGLGTLPGDSFSFASGISADGSVVVGESGVFGGSVRAVRWIAVGGITELPGLSTNVDSFAVATSADGSVTVGGSQAPPDYFQQGVRWGPGGDPVGLGFLPTDPDSCCYSQASAVSGDGSVVVGYGSSGTTEEAFRWTPGDGIVGLGTLLGDMASNAMGVSADGSVVVGSSFFQDADVLRNEPYRWTAATGMVDIGQLPGANYSNVRGISPNGSVIVGEGIRIDYPAGSFVWTEAFRWTSGSGMVGLGFLPGGRDLPLPFSEAVATSADGLRVVGQARSVDGADIAMIWDPIHGMRSLQDVLVNDYGLDLTGWTLGGATAISADGRTIAGFGTSPSGQFQGWIAVLPDPSEATVCHKGRKTLTLDAHAAAAHLAHGDSAGACSD